jgi:hypothetical protein
MRGSSAVRGGALNDRAGWQQALTIAPTLTLSQATTARVRTCYTRFAAHGVGYSNSVGPGHDRNHGSDGGFGPTNVTITVSEPSYLQPGYRE